MSYDTFCFVFCVLWFLVCALPAEAHFHLSPSRRLCTPLMRKRKRMRSTAFARRDHPQPNPLQPSLPSFNTSPQLWARFSRYPTITELKDTFRLLDSDRSGKLSRCYYILSNRYSVLIFGVIIQGGGSRRLPPGRLQFEREAARGHHEEVGCKAAGWRLMVT